MKNLNDICKDAHNYGTRKGADKKLASVTEYIGSSIGFVFERENGHFVAMVGISQKDMWAARQLAENGCFVFTTN